MSNMQCVCEAALILISITFRASTLILEQQLNACLEFNLISVFVCFWIRASSYMALQNVNIYDF